MSLYKLLDKGNSLPSSCAFDVKEVDLVIIDQPSEKKSLETFIKKNPGFYFYQGYEGSKILLFKDKPETTPVVAFDSFHRGGMSKVKLADGTTLLVALDLDSTDVSLSTKI